MPPAGLEPAALCLASSIRLSLTARSTGLLAGLYLGHHSPGPYSLWGALSLDTGEVSCGLPNPLGLLLAFEYRRL